jgi:mannose-1-phosphate guanylyltransferase
LPQAVPQDLSSTSSLQQAVQRVAAKDVFARPIIMTIEPYRFLVRQQLEEIGCDAEIVIEPERRDSGPAIAAAMLVPPETSAVRQRRRSNRGSRRFPRRFPQCRDCRRARRLVTFGITPRRATGAYGYIRLRRTGRWRSRCLARRASSRSRGSPLPERLMADGCVWNSGNFVFRADTVIDHMSSSIRQPSRRFATASPRRNAISASCASTAPPLPRPGAARSTMR